MLYLSATNDGHGRMDLAFRTLDSLASAVRSQVFTPNYDHHVEPAEAKSLPLFMDCHLKTTSEKWPATAKVEFAAGAGGVPEIRVIPAEPEQVAKVDVLYCLDNDWPTTRFWRLAGETKRANNIFTSAAAFPEGSYHVICLRQRDVAARTGGSVRVSGEAATSPASQGRSLPFSGRH